MIPRRWAVERTFAWITSYRRLARDYERHPATVEAIIRWAAINTMTRRIARGTPATRPGPRQSPPHKDLKHALSRPVLFPGISSGGDDTNGTTSVGTDPANRAPVKLVHDDWVSAPQWRGSTTGFYGTRRGR